MCYKPTVLFLILVLTHPAASQSIEWIEDSFDDFADGQFDAAGHNLYVSRDGRVRTIHRFDLNQDGYLDLVFNSTHDTTFFVPATFGSVDNERRVRSEEMAIDGSLHVVLADLNGDGHSEAVFCPNYSGLQSERRFVTIAWGDKEGWLPRRTNGSLPVHGASDIAVCELNNDRWPEIVVLNGNAWLPEQPDGQIVRIFWGSDSGYQATERSDVGIVDAKAIESGDWDGDGTANLVVLRSSGSLRIFSADKDAEPRATSYDDWPLDAKEVTCLTMADVTGDGKIETIVGTADASGSIHIVPSRKGRMSGRPTRSFNAFQASHIAAGDLDDDGATDLVLTRFKLARAGGGEAMGTTENEGIVHVLWGDPNRPGNFASDRRLALKVHAPSATTVGDVDSDGHSDLVIAVHQGDSTFKAGSVVLYGTGGRDLVPGPDVFPSQGATSVAIAPKEENLPPRIVFANSLGGTLNEAVPLQVYWGQPDGFDPNKSVKIPFRSGYESTAADFNTDGFVDLLAINSQHGGNHDDPFGGANIFWGSASGFDFEGERTVVREANLGTSSTADLDRDGHLDLVLGTFDAASADATAELIIRYGSANGFSSNRRVTLPSAGRSIGTQIADFNRDDSLDIAVTSYRLNRLRIFWGSVVGFSAERQTNLPALAAIGLETADGYLDLIVGSYQDPVTHLHDPGTLIYWGSFQGYRPSDAQRLPATAPVGYCVADFDGDGHLDLFSPHYLGDGTREKLPCYLFWGSAEGFSASRRTSLICDSAHDALAGDFDRDGRLDLAVVCHSRDGTHYTDSLIFFNDGKRFKNPRMQRLPTHGPHWMWLQDMGHIYHRRWEQTYTSSVFDIERPCSRGELRYRAQVPTGTRLSFSVRSATEELEGQPWHKVEPGAPFTLSTEHSYLQYRATLGSDNGDRFPILDRVEVKLQP